MGLYLNVGQKEVSEEKRRVGNTGDAGDVSRGGVYDN